MVDDGRLRWPTATPPVFPASRAEAQSMFGGGVDGGAEDAEERGDVGGDDR